MTASNDSNRWIARSQTEVAAALGVHRRTVGEWIGKGCPGKPQWYRIPEIVSWARANIWKARPAPVIVASEDEALLAGDSPALERWREARARLAELDLAVREGQLIVAADYREMLMMTANAYRGAAERIQRQYGEEAADIIREAIEDCQRIVERRFGGEELLPDEEGENHE